MKNQKGFVSVVLAVLVLALLGVGGYSMMKKKSIPVNQIVQNQDSSDLTGKKCGGGVAGGGIWMENGLLPEGYTCDLTGVDLGGEGKIVKIIYETYTNTQNGFEFKYPNDEKVEVLDKSAVFPNNVGKKIISVQLKNPSEVSNVKCVAGVDTKCNNIFVDSHNIVIQHGTLGNIIARADLVNGKSILLSVSCDFTTKSEKSLVGTGDYCVIAGPRQEMFQSLLSTFKFTK